MIRVVLIDDEELAIQTLERILSKFSNISVVGSFTDPIKGLMQMATLKPDVVFLDIEMPVINGFEVARQLVSTSEKIQIVFVTAFDDYAVRAFELNSLDYLLKPVTPERMEKTVNRILSSDSKGISEKTIDSAIKQSKIKMNKVVLNENEKLIVINPFDIYYFTTEGNSVQIITEDKVFSSKETLLYWEEKMIQFDFFRCHKSFLVNLQKVSEIHSMFNNTYIIRLTNKKAEIPVSRRYSASLKNILEL